MGRFHSGSLLTRAAGLGDIRRIGSGNIGATNVLRTGNRTLAAATLLLDGVKGAVAVLLAAWFGGRDAVLWAGIGAVLGHAFPVWLGFGGQGRRHVIRRSDRRCLAGRHMCRGGVAGRGGGCSISSPRRARLVRAGADFAAVLADGVAVNLTLAIAVLVFARHYTNIRRLLAGTEPRIGQKA